MKKLFRLFTVRTYLYLFENRILKWINDDKIQKFKNNLRYSGENLQIKLPLKSNGLQYVSIGDNFYASNNLRIETWDKYNGDIFFPEITIGNNVHIEEFCQISSINKIIISDNVLIASGVYISDHFHGNTDLNSLKIRPALRNLFSKGPVIIEKNVWIGQGVCILPDVTIGENSIVGANSVVTRSVPKNVIVAGIPAKIIRYINE